MAKLAPQARAALRARRTLPPLPTRAHRLILRASRIMTGVKSTFADECRGFEAVQAEQWASSGELGAVDGLYGLLLELARAGHASKLWREDRREAARSGREVERGGCGGGGGLLRWAARGTELSLRNGAIDSNRPVASCVVVVHGRQTGAQEHFGALGSAMDIDCARTL